MQPRIYVVCEMAYRFNIKHGDWITVPSTVSELKSAIQAILDISPIPGNDWLILDYEGFNSDCHIQKNEDLETVVEQAKEAILEKKAANLEKELRQFTGTQNYYKHHHQIAIGTTIFLTDGIKYLCDTAGAYWLIDLIASYQPQLRKEQETMLREFQFWEVTVNLTEQKGYVQCWEDRPSDYSEPFVHQDLDYTDFPLSDFRLYGVYQEKYLVLMLPSEY